MRSKSCATDASIWSSQSKSFGAPMYTLRTRDATALGARRLSGVEFELLWAVLVGPASAIVSRLLS